jgi:pyrroline-5-carboxylate reductase
MAGDRPDSDRGHDIQIGMIGGGRMAQALAAGFHAAGLVPAEAIAVYDPAAGARDAIAARVPGIRLVDSPAAAAVAPLVFLAVKPQQAATACGEVAGCLAAASGQPPVLVSIVAGLSLASLARLVGNDRVIRVMPNTPCLVGRGVSAVAAATAVPAEARERVRRLLAAVGEVHEVDESLLDAVTGLSGSGPGFIARFVEALAAGGVEAGLPEPLALALATQTLAGTGALLVESGAHPAAVREQVTSPGGTTFAGLTLLDERGVPAAIAAAVVAAARRSAELGRSA